MKRGLFLVLISFLFLPMFLVGAEEDNALAESCFIQLNINETKIQDNFDENESIVSPDIGFSLLGQDNLFGIYSGQVNVYNEEIFGDYIITTYDSFDHILNKYSAYSGRFLLYDNFGEYNLTDGGIIELNESEISEIIPYDSQISKITISNNGIESDLAVDPSQFNCQRTCKISGEVLGEGERCCAGFVKYEFNDIEKCSNQTDCSALEVGEKSSCLSSFGILGEFTCLKGMLKTEFGCIDCSDSLACTLFGRSRGIISKWKSDEYSTLKTMQEIKRLILNPGEIVV